ncbi:hypothetical protein [Rhizobacter sp. P5_C2]
MRVAKLLLITCALAFLTSRSAAQAQALLFDHPFSQQPAHEGFGPVIDVRVRGRLESFVLDTGSSPSLVVSEAAPRLRGHAGGPTCRHALQIQLGSETAAAVPCEVIPTIPEFAAAKLAGMLSPQQLAPNDLVVLDFPSSRLFALHATGEPFDEFRKLYPDRSSVRLERIGESIGAMLVRGAWGDRAEVLIDIDTGRPYTQFARRYLEGAPTDGSSATLSAMGERSVNQQSLQAQPLRIGSIVLAPIRIRTRDEAGVAAGVVYEGSLGRDVLKACAIGIPPRRERQVYLACR